MNLKAGTGYVNRPHLVVRDDDIKDGSKGGFRMNRHGRPFYILLTVFLVFVFACVTVNIYFPAEKVESVAGDIVKDVRGNKEAPPSSPPRTARVHNCESPFLLFLPQMLGHKKRRPSPIPPFAPLKIS